MLCFFFCKLSQNLSKFSSTALVLDSLYVKYCTVKNSSTVSHFMQFHATRSGITVFLNVLVYCTVNKVVQFNGLVIYVCWYTLFAYQKCISSKSLTSPSEVFKYLIDHKSFVQYVYLEIWILKMLFRITFSTYKLLM